MSIFKDTLQLSVQEQLNARQAALKARTPDAIVYSNSRNSWIRMSSSVDVGGKDSLAKQYILQGGVLLNNKLRFGVGGADKAYSNFTPSLTSYNSTTRNAGTAGIKPMPGIESIDIKSKSAYGSLREVVVNFKCHNLQQLEDLELLYMRPGYTVLIEWGWTPYLDKNGKIKNDIKFYDGLFDSKKTREQIWLELYKLSETQSHNYDALFGYVKNYNWTARMDGGYDCSTTIISIGEIMESLKVNYLPFDVEGIVKNKGLLGLIQNVPVPTTNVTVLPFSTNPPEASYSKNILAGLLHEIFAFTSTLTGSFPKLSGTGQSFIELPKSYDYNLYKFTYPTELLPNTLTTTAGSQIYITLGSFIDLLNKYILLHAGKDQATSTPLVTLSAKSNTYSSNGNPLLCLAHPLQVSIDPTVCLITNPLWAKGISFKGLDKGSQNGAPTKYDAQASEIFELIQNSGPAQQGPIGQKLIDTIGYGKPGYLLQNAKDFIRSFYFAAKKKNPNYTNEAILNLLKKIDDDVKQIGEDTDTYRNLFTLVNFTATENEIKERKANEESLKKSEEAFGVEYLKQLGDGGLKFENENETGIIENIYLNIDFLYRLSVEQNLQDSKTQELKLFDYLKQMLTEVQSSIGGVNNFEIHVDPIDNVARIIDLNYVDTMSKTDAYKTAFQIEAQNLSGTVRSYNMQSKIFPEQAAMISIGAQVKATSAQGTSASTLLDFNNNLYDRVIGGKYDPPSSLSKSTDDDATQFKKLKDSINRIKDFFFPPTATGNKQASDTTPATNPTPTDYKAALKDLITYFSTVAKTSTNGRSIIPIQISLTMDGIGGLVIGHLFKIPPDLLPKGYGSDTIGGKLIQTIIGISHKVASGDWTTTIDAQNIVTNDSSGGIEPKFSDLLTEGKNNYTINVPQPGAMDIPSLSGDWKNRAFQVITIWEGFKEVAKPDAGTLRGGYGSDKKLVNGKPQQVVASTTFTRAEAKDTLIYLIENDYGPNRVIKSLGKATFDSLNDNQKAALISYAYNVGNINKLVSSIKSKDFATTAALIKEGPITSKGVVVDGLVIRRAKEALVFSKPI
jgi:GH24 family phage-related lysozyme (muramidase)